MVSEKRYFREDLALGLVDSAWDVDTLFIGDNDSFDLGIRVFIDGVIELTGGSPALIATCGKGATGYVTLTGNWDLLGDWDLSSSTVEIRVYGKLHSDAVWTYLGVWTTEALSDTKLNACIWALSFRVDRIRIAFDSYSYAFNYGESHSFVNNFTHSTPAAPPLPFSSDTLETGPFKAFLVGQDPFLGEVI